MTTHKLVFRTLFLALSYLIMLLLLLFIFGEDGLLVTNSLKARYRQLEKTEGEYEMRLSALEKRLSASYDESAYDDMALSLGYNRDGEKVFYFDEPDVFTEDVSAPVTVPAAEIYNGVETWKLALFSLAAPAAVLIVLVIIALKEKGDDDKFFRTYGTEGGYDDYIN